MRRLRICVIGSSRFPVSEPFAGGLEAHTHALVRALIARGHTVTLFAAPGSDPALGLRTLDVEPFSASPLARADVSAAPATWMQEHHAYLALMLDLQRTGSASFDIVHNNSLHHLPIAMSAALDVPMVTTLHTPPTPWLESAMRFSGSRAVFAAVSSRTSAQWEPVVPSVVIPNGIDLARWPLGPGGGDAVWFGRLVPEKAPHLAIDAARAAGIPIVLAGPAFDERYFDTEIAPRLGVDARYAGHLGTAALARLVGRSAVSVVTPRWEEPFGLVAAESMSTGTPVAAFARGALPDVVGATGGALARADDVDDLARAIGVARTMSRTDARTRAVAHYSLDAMVDRYENLYDDLTEWSCAA